MLLATPVLAIPLREHSFRSMWVQVRKNPMHPGSVPIAAAQALVPIRNFSVAHAFARHGMQFAQCRSVLLSQVDAVILRGEFLKDHVTSVWAGHDYEASGAGAEICERKQLITY
jgi:hypothetical protein